MNRYEIEYWYGTYHGVETVWADDSEQAVARMWAGFRRRGLMTLPMAYQAARVISVIEGGC